MATTSGTALSGPRRRRPIQWLRASLQDSRMETRTARTLVFDVPGWPGHHAGQHVDVKVTADDGYSAQRSYSIASIPSSGRVELTIQAVSGGEVSPYLVHDMRPGDQLELRGPIGGWLRWTEDLEEPVLLVAGGAGIVPLMAMLRQRNHAGSATPFHLVYSVRTPDHLFYGNELHTIGRNVSGVTIDRIYSRSGLPDDPRPLGRLTSADIPEAADSTAYGTPRVYVCGPSEFVEHATQILAGRGHLPAAVRTERFGPSGG